jgi:hypothetical protein
MAEKAITGLDPAENMGLDKQSSEVSHHNEVAVEIALTPKEQKRLM